MKHQYIAEAFVVITFGIASIANAGGGQTFSLSPIGNAGGTTAQPATADSGETVKVQGRGVGADKDEALKNAYRDAVERAVGRYVDAEVAVANDQIIKKQILTQSNAYITDYQEIEEKRLDGGLVQLRILATVKKQALAKKLSGVMPTQTFQLGNEGAQVHANQVTTEKRGEDAAALLKNVLDGVNPIKQLMRLSLADTKMLRKAPEKTWSNNNKEYCYYKFKFELDEHKYYNEFLPSLIKVLDQISLETPKTVRFSRTYESDPPKGRSHENKMKEMYLAGEWESVHVNADGSMGGLNGGKAVPCDVMILAKSSEAWALDSRCGNNCRPDDAIFHRYGSNDKRTDMLSGESFQVVVITAINPNRTIANARHYKLPTECAEPIIEWQIKLVGTLFEGFHRNVRTHYDIVFKDGNGSEIYSQPFDIENGSLVNTMIGRGVMFDPSDGGRGGRYGYGWYVTPMIHTDAQSLQRWIGFDIPLDVLPSIRAVSIEFAD